MPMTINVGLFSKRFGSKGNNIWSNVDGALLCFIQFLSINEYQCCYAPFWLVSYANVVTTYFGSLTRHKDMNSLAISETPSKSSGGKSKVAVLMFLKVS